MRVTAFPEVPQSKMPGWKDLIGTEPQERRETPAAQVIAEGGPYLDALFEVIRTANSVEWRLRAPPSKGQPMGRFADRAPPFIDACKNWLSLLPSVVRVAFGAMLQTRFQNEEAARASMKEHVKDVTFDGLSMMDFVYRSNRPRTLVSLPDVRANRLSTFAAEQRTFMSLDVSLQSGRAPASSTHWVGLLELDINTVQTHHKRIPANKLKPLVQELFEMGTAIAAKGTQA